MAAAERCLGCRPRREIVSAAVSEAYCCNFGAIPTVVLYGLLPPLAALHTRRTAAPRADVVPAAALAAVAAGALGVLAVNLSHLVVVC